MSLCVEVCEWFLRGENGRSKLVFCGGSYGVLKEVKSAFVIMNFLGSISLCYWCCEAEEVTLREFQ